MMACGRNQVRLMVVLLSCGLELGCSDHRSAIKEQTSDESRSGAVLGSGDKPFVLELGEVPMDSSHSKQVPVTNATGRSIRIDGFEASCECTSVGGLPLEVPAGETRDVTVLTDLAKEPGFTGGLAIIVTLRSGIAVRGKLEVRCTVTHSESL